MSTLIHRPYRILIWSFLITTEPSFLIFDRFSFVYLNRFFVYCKNTSTSLIFEFRLVAFWS